MHENAPTPHVLKFCFFDLNTDFVILIALNFKASAVAVNLKKKIFVFVFCFCIHALASWNIHVEVNASKLSGQLSFIVLTRVRFTCQIKKKYRN